MNKPTDIVVVILRHGNTTVETRACKRSEAERIGEALVAQYQPFLDCHYVVEPEAVVKKPKPIRFVTPKSNVIPHYFKILT